MNSATASNEEEANSSSNGSINFNGPSGNPLPNGTAWSCYSPPPLYDARWDRDPATNDCAVFPLPSSVSLHPLAAATLRQRLADAVKQQGGSTLDPLTVAFLCRQQQEDEGQPKSPLSPHTLQRCLAAMAAGQPFPLTPEAVLAPTPLALTWHGNDTSEDGGAADRITSSRVEELTDDNEEAAPAVHANRKRAFMDMDYNSSGSQGPRRRMRREGMACAPAPCAFPLAPSAPQWGILNSCSIAAASLAAAPGKAGKVKRGRDWEDGDEAADGWAAYSRRFE